MQGAVSIRAEFGSLTVCVDGAGGGGEAGDGDGGYEKPMGIDRIQTCSLSGIATSIAASMLPMVLRIAFLVYACV